MTRHAGGLYELRVALADSQQGKQGPQLYNYKELDSINNLNELGSEFSFPEFGHQTYMYLSTQGYHTLEQQSPALLTPGTRI